MGVYMVHIEHIVHIYIIYIYYIPRHIHRLFNQGDAYEEMKASRAQRLWEALEDLKQKMMEPPCRI